MFVVTPDILLDAVQGAGQCADHALRNRREPGSNHRLPLETWRHPKLLRTTCRVMRAEIPDSTGLTPLHSAKMQRIS